MSLLCGLFGACWWAACRLLICLFDFMLVWVLVDCCGWLICGLFTAVDLTFVLLLCRFAVWLVASDGLWAGVGFELVFRVCLRFGFVNFGGL